MNILDIPVPEVYKTESADFRFFMKWFALALSKVQYDTEEFFDLLDPLRCPADLLWLLGETVGYSYDERSSTAFNRLVLVYFMSMIRLKGSKDGLTLAAQVNLDKLKLKELAKQNPILDNRLEDTSIPCNSVYVQPHVQDGYIDLVYFSDQLPEDTCTEYVRPVGMYLIPHAGVRYDAIDRIAVDARLTDLDDLNMSIGPTHVGHYRKDDYARMQKLTESDLDPDDRDSVRDTQHVSRKDRGTGTLPSPLSDTRNRVWYRNSAYEDANGIDYNINPGYRALSSLQFANGDIMMRAAIRGMRSSSAISPNDVVVQDASTGRTYDTTYYQAQAQAAAQLAALINVPSQPMGDMGGAMTSLTSDDASAADADSTSDTGK